MDVRILCTSSGYFVFTDRGSEDTQCNPLGIDSARTHAFQGTGGSRVDWKRSEVAGNGLGVGRPDAHQKPFHLKASGSATP